ncbi:excisionase [Variovorax paradoxus]|nr:excisionase family protein [Variovorax paradoxus]MBT2304710.1 excisionase [Variovorax paradoxus]
MDDLPVPVYLAPDRYVTIALASVVGGYSQNAIRCKIKAGTWIEDREYIRAPDGHVMIDREGVQRWITRRM